MVKLKRFLTVFLLSFALSLPCVMEPSPVRAASEVVEPDSLAAAIAAGVQRLKNLASELKWLGEIIKIIANIYTMLQEYFADMTERAENGAKLLTQATEAQTRIDAKLAQARIDEEAYNTLVGATLDLAAEHVVPKHEYLCKSILLNNAVKTTRQHELATSRMVVNSIMAAGRGPTDDYDGGLYIADEEELRCLAKFGSVVGGDDPKCIDDTKVGPDKRTFADADLLPFSMDGSVTLEIPDVTSKAINYSDGSVEVVSVPNPKNVNQRMWLAALYYCYQLAGPRPTPAWGAASSSRPVSKTERTRFDQALPVQSVEIKPCGDLMAYYSRPNQAASTTLIAEQKKLCSAADGLIPADEKKNRFDDCEKGLSPYQADLLRQVECKSPHSYMANLQAGGTFWEGSDDAIICSTSWNNWMTKVAAKQGALVDAVRGIQQGKSNWTGIGGSR